LTVDALLDAYALTTAVIFVTIRPLDPAIEHRADRPQLLALRLAQVTARFRREERVEEPAQAARAVSVCLDHRKTTLERGYTLCEGAQLVVHRRLMPSLSLTFSPRPDGRLGHG